MKPAQKFDLLSLYNELCQLRQSVLEQGSRLYHAWQPHIERNRFLYSAWNLALYLALRCHDLRPLQKQVLPLGLSSLGRGEARTMTNLDAIVASLGRICGVPADKCLPYPSAKRFFYGNTMLAYSTSRLFGTGKTGTRIMVTLPTEAAQDGGILIHQLVAAGTDCVRINCAHDNPTLWKAMIDFVRQAEQETGRHCKVFMDLAGPKVRIESVLLRFHDGKVFPGEQVFLVRGAISDYPAEYRGNIVLSCSIPEVFKHLQTGQPVLIDDGKIRAEVEQVVPQGAYLKITYTRPKGGKIRNEKALNFPQTPIDVSPLTPKDKKDLGLCSPGRRWHRLFFCKMCRGCEAAAAGAEKTGWRRLPPPGPGPQDRDPGSGGKPAGNHRAGGIPPGPGHHDRPGGPGRGSGIPAAG